MIGLIILLLIRPIPKFSAKLITNDLFTMNEKLRKKAGKIVQAKMSFYICTIIFSFTTIILLMLGTFIPSISFWLKLPIPVFVMVLAILYISAFGLPFTGPLAGNWKEEEIEKELIKLYRKKKARLQPGEELSESEILELKELERHHRRWDDSEDLV